MTWLYILHVYIQKGTIISEENEKKRKKKKINTEVNFYCGTVLFLHTHNAYNTMMAYVCPYMQDRLLLRHNNIYIRLLIISIKQNCIYIQHDINNLIT